MKKIAIIGAGGFGKEVASIIQNINEVALKWQIIGFFDDALHLQGTDNAYGKVLGNIEKLNQFEEPVNAVIAMGRGELISKIRKRINNKNIIFPNIIHPTTLFLDKATVKMGEGNIFSAHTIISCGIEIGNYNIFNTRVTLGHDDKIGDYNIFSPNVQLSGDITIGNLNYFGFNCGIIQKRKIGNNNTLGAGAILLRNAKDGDTYIGNPAIKVKF